MHLSETKELREELAEGVSLTDMQKYQVAIKLNIEVITFIELCREAEPGMVPELFPGETERRGNEPQHRPTA